MASNEVLTIRAGKRALEQIRRSGLNAADIEIIPGAAGGPKGLGISGLDRAIFGEWLPSAPGVRHLIGASIGAWRFAAACRTNPLGALDEFARAYTEQSYPPRPSRKLVSQSARTMLGGLFSGREDEILNHPHYRLHILTVRGRWPTRSAGATSRASSTARCSTMRAILRRSSRARSASTPSIPMPSPWIA